MFNLKDYLKQEQLIINNALKKHINQLSKTSKLIKAMDYSLMAGGKRLRPILCLSAARCVGNIDDIIINAACALEMIHTYSLIHDDLPAMDNDDLRRGKPTCHKAFNEATAILAGDALLTHSFYLLSNCNVKNNSSKLIQVINILSNAIGCNGMIEGQMLDIDSENIEISLYELENIHKLKTGALIEASVHIGAILGGGSKNEIEHLKNYSRYIGIAFQITDDILNVCGNPEIMGKAAGTDKKLQKSTYPSLIGLEKSKELANEYIKKAINYLEIFGQKALPLSSIANYIIERKL